MLVFETKHRRAFRMMFSVACARVPIEIDVEDIKRFHDDCVEVLGGALHVLFDPNHLFAGEMDNDLNTWSFAVFGSSCNQDADVGSALEPLLQATDSLVDIRTDRLGHFKMMTFDGNLHVSLL